MFKNCTVPEEIDQAVKILRNGGLIAFPTETYYGLAVDPFNERALKRLFSVKKRPALKPVLVLIPSREHLARLSDRIPDAATKLMNRFWPGALTLVFPAREGLSDNLTGGTGTIGVRISPHPVAHALLQAYNDPLTATSANRSGENAAVTDHEVMQIFGDDIDMVLHGGRTTGLQPSTLVGFSDNTVECIREGCIAVSEIQQALDQTI